MHWSDVKIRQFKNWSIVAVISTKLTIKVATYFIMQLTCRVQQRMQHLRLSSSWLTKESISTIVITKWGLLFTTPSWKFRIGKTVSRLIRLRLWAVSVDARALRLMCAINGKRHHSTMLLKEAPQFAPCTLWHAAHNLREKTFMEIPLLVWALCTSTSITVSS